MFEVASRKLGIERAVLGQSRGRNKGPNLSASEMERLLRQGAYGQLMENDDKASRVFVERDIEEILAKNAREVVMHTFGSSSGLFAKTTFASKTSDMELDIDDPSFWKKVLKTRCASELHAELMLKMSTFDSDTNTTTMVIAAASENSRSSRKKTETLVSNAMWKHKWNLVQNMIPEVEYLVDDVKMRQQQLGGLDSTKSAQDIVKLRRDTESLVKLLTEILSGSDDNDNTENSVEIMRQWLHDVSGSRLRRRRQQDVYVVFERSVRE